MSCVSVFALHLVCGVVFLGGVFYYLFFFVGGFGGVHVKACLLCVKL